MKQTSAQLYRMFFAIYAEGDKGMTLNKLSEYALNTFRWKTDELKRATSTLVENKLIKLGVVNKQVMVSRI